MKFFAYQAFFLMALAAAWQQTGAPVIAADADEAADTCTPTAVASSMVLEQGAAAWEPAPWLPAETSGGEVLRMTGDHAQATFYLTTAAPVQLLVGSVDMPGSLVEVWGQAAVGAGAVAPQILPQRSGSLTVEKKSGRTAVSRGAVAEGQGDTFGMADVVFAQPVASVTVSMRASLGDADGIVVTRPAAC